MAKLPGYKYLLTYRYAEIICDLNTEFVRLYIDFKSRTKDQMEQAARSGKQNIIEGVTQQTSHKIPLKLLGIANSSFEELLADYEDYLRQHSLSIYPIDNPKIQSFRQTAYRLSNLSNLSSLGFLIEKPILPNNPTDAANFLLTLCHLETYLLSKQIIAARKKFISEGGFTEKLFKDRLKNKNNRIR